MAMKRVSELYRSTPYIRHGLKNVKSRPERETWSITLKDVITMNEDSLIRRCTRDELLQNKKGTKCPHCRKGVLGKLRKIKGRGLRYRCPRKKCQQWVSPHHDHPLFTDAWGAAHVPFKGQVELLVCNLSGATHTCTHHLLGQSHNSAERLSKRLNEQRCKYVRKQEKSLVFGTGKAWYDVEADEASFAKKRCEDEDGEPTNLLEWEQWAGIIERGRPESLMLFKTNSSQTNLRAPGPGAIKKTDWAPVAQRHLEGRNIVLHTDKARSYTMKVPGVLHDAVRHSKKVVMRKGKRVMLQPTYTRLSTHKLPNGKLLHTKAGSQI